MFPQLAIDAFPVQNVKVDAMSKVMFQFIRITVLILRYYFKSTLLFTFQACICLKTCKNNEIKVAKHTMYSWDHH